MAEYNTDDTPPPPISDLLVIFDPTPATKQPQPISPGAGNTEETPGPKAAEIFLKSFFL